MLIQEEQHFLVNDESSDYITVTQAWQVDGHAPGNQPLRWHEPLIGSNKPFF